MKRLGGWMVRGIYCLSFLLFTSAMAPQEAPSRRGFEAFEVATIKQVEPGNKDGRYLKMEATNRFLAKNYTIKLLLAAAFDLSPRAVSGGPAWMDTDHFDILAVTPGDLRPTREEQMAMMRRLLAERFKLAVHREPKEFAIYVLEVAKGGPKLKASTASAEEPSNVICTVYPERVLLPARNVTMREVALMMQRAIFDRPVVDRTGLTGRYDFDLDWAADETQFGGAIPAATAAATSPPLFVAMQDQLGLKLEATRGLISALVVDGLERPTAN